MPSTSLYIQEIKKSLSLVGFEPAPDYFVRDTTIWSDVLFTIRQQSATDQVAVASIKGSQVQNLPESTFFVSRMCRLADAIPTVFKKKSGRLFKPG